METQQLCQMGQAGGVMVGIAVFRFIVGDLVDYLVVGDFNKWSLSQVKDCGEMAYNEAYWMSISELKLFVTRVKGSYYKSNQNFKPAVFMEWLQDFISEMNYERAEYYSKKERLAANKVEAARQDIPDNTIPPERLDELFAELRQNLTKAVEQVNAEESAGKQTASSVAREKMNKFISREVDEEVQKEMERLRTKTKV